MQFLRVLLYITVHWEIFEVQNFQKDGTISQINFRGWSSSYH